jgi:hypothetical protein
MSRDLLPAVAKQKYYQPEKWTAFHRYIVALEAAGSRPGEIAKATGLSAARVSVILNDQRAEIIREEIGEKIVDSITDVTMRLRLLSNEAVDELADELRHCEDVRVRQKAATEILDRAGYSRYQGEILPSQDFGEEAAERIEKAVGEISLVEGVDYTVEGESAD